MNETRKQIIEFIWDYMDKSLSEGCIFTQSWSYWKKTRWCKVTNSHTVREKDYLCYEYPTSRWYDWGELPDTLFKSTINTLNEGRSQCVYWHYDITAVEKYILLHENYDYWFDHRSYYEYKIFYDKNWKWTDIRIPNKPLLLYSETEEKELLDLLKNITL